MSLEIPSAQDLAQSALRTLRSRRLKRKNYRYYEGYKQIDLRVEDQVLHLTAAVDQEVHGITVLHGRNIVYSVAPLSDQLKTNVAAGATNQIDAQISLVAILDAWKSYRDQSHEDLSSVQREDALQAKAKDERSDIERPDEELYSGTVRFAFSFEAHIDELPSGIAWLQLEKDGQLRRRKEVMAQIASGVLILSKPVIAHRIIGRFERTYISGGAVYETGGRSAGLYINKNAEVAMAINRPLTQKYRIRTDLTNVREGTLNLAGELETQTDRIRSLTLQVVGRRSSMKIERPVAFNLDQEMTARRFGRAMYSWQASLDFANVDWSEIDRGDNYDLFLISVSEPDAEPKRIRVSRTPFLVRSTTRADAVSRGNETLAISPYFTFKAKSTSLILEVFDSDAFSVVAESKERCFPVTASKSKPVWIIGELSYKAQDNGLHLFKYLRNKRPDIDAYFVIDENSPDLRNFDSLDHVVFHGSKKHFELAIRAERFIGTHHPDYLYPTRHHSFSTRTRATRVFLQHGVMGTKWMVPNYGKNSPGFSTDLFMVSSEREKQYIVNDFHYSEDEVKVVGLSRFDALLSRNVEVNDKLLLVIPTWRDWLQSEDSFLASEYLFQWKALLNSAELAKMVDQHGLEVVFCLHPNMMQFRDHFKDSPARLIVQGEVDVQELIKTAAVMVTDYSSVNFDFSFLHKPVHYFQFDRSRFLGPNGSHLELDRELPGKIAFDSKTLLVDLEQTLNRGKTMEDEYRRRADVFLKYRDQNNSQRITNEIENASLRSKSGVAWKSELPDKLKRRFRRNKRYFSIMRKLYKVFKLAPINSELIVFESGLGRQYGDSPRYIYEELVRQGDKRQKIWVYSGRHRFADPKTKTIKRLSPEYFWYLARAKYWVNNQSFPHYLKRRKDGIFLQTWHGTPLKQMALDIREVHGRDEGYLERVIRATQQWTHLISPSTYTSEILRSAYSFSGEAVEVGYPRNDILVGDTAGDLEKRVREELSIPLGSKALLYAPTFRDDASAGRGKYKFDLPLDLREFDRRFGKDTILMLRMHVLVANAVSIPEDLQDRVIDVSDYPDIQELYLAADVLITDYSSVFFDYALLRRPIIFYAYDLENYRDNLRGFYLDYENALPGPIVESEDALWDSVLAALTGEQLREADRQEFIRKFAPYDDGYASKRVVDRFFR